MTALGLIRVQVEYAYVKWSELVDPIFNGGDLPDFYSLEYSADSTNWYVVNPQSSGYKWVLNITHNPGTILTTRSYYRMRA